MTIYKYFDYRGVDVLRMLQLKVTPPDQFNDLFEFTPIAKGGLGNSDIAQLSNREAMYEFYETHKEQLGEHLSDFESFFRRTQENDKGYFDMIEKFFKANMTENCLSYCKDASRLVGIICFTPKPNNLLMWSHYANGHKGLVIGFNADHPFLRERVRMRDVNYPPGDERSVWDSSMNPDDKGYEEMIDALALTKSHHWQYESEMRALLRLDGLERRLISDGVLGYFLSFPPDLIEEVIVGYRAFFATEDAIRQALGIHGISEKKLLRTKPHLSKFDLEFEPVEKKLKPDWIDERRRNQ